SPALSLSLFPSLSSPVSLSLPLSLSLSLSLFTFSLSLSLSLPLSGEEDVGTSCGRIGGGAKSKRWQTFYMQLPHWFSRAIAHTRLALARLNMVLCAAGKTFSVRAMCY